MTLAPLALSLGDPAGIGPEITVKAWRALREQGPAFMVVGDAHALASAPGTPAPIRAVTGPEEALRVFSAADVLCAGALDYAGFRAAPQTAHRQTFCDVDQFPFGALPLPRVPGGDREWPLGPTPRVGEHTLEVLAEAGVAEAECTALLAAGVIRQAS